MNTGAATVVLWSADTTFEVIDGTAGDWIGLYEAGACADQPSWESGELTLGGTNSEDRHKCWKDQHFLGDKDASGQVRMNLIQATLRGTQPAKHTAIFVDLLFRLVCVGYFHGRRSRPI